MNLRKVFFPAVVLSFAFLFLSARTARAADGGFPDISGIDCSIYTTNATLWDAAVNQQRFAQDMVTSIVTGPLMTSTVGVNLEQICKCAKDTQANNYDPESADECDKVKTFITTGGVFMTAKYAFDITEGARDLINIKYYARDLLKNSPFSKTAYAAIKDDPSPLPAIIEVWKRTRNVSYTLFAAVFIVIGFMIMFRKRLDPQTVVTIQNALPRVVVSLILITFSYPLVSVIFSLSAPLNGLAKDLVDHMGAGVVNLVLRIAASIGIGFLASIPGGGVLGLAVGLLFGILFVALIIGFIIYCITFVTRLGKVALLTALAPFILLIGAVPGNEKTILNWFKSILSVTLQIPALTFVLWLGIKVASVMAPYGTPPGIFIVALVLNPMIGTYILFQAGKVPKMVDSALGVEPILFGDSGPKKGKR